MVFDGPRRSLVLPPPDSSAGVLRVLSRRELLGGLGLLTLSPLLTRAEDASDAPSASPSPTAAGQPVQLVHAAQAGDLTRVHAVAEVNGHLKLNPDGKQVKKLPLKGTGEFLYDERLVTAGSAEQPTIHVRHYREAAASVQVGEETIATRLRPDQRLIGVKTTDAHAVLFSPLGPLTKDELELIDVQGITTAHARLLPENPVSVGETWTLPNEAVAILLRLDVLTENKLTATLKKVAEGVGYGEISGTASGSVGGVATDLELTAKFNVQIAQQRLTWLAMSVQENRAIGHAEPGLEVTARIRIEIAPLEQSPELADAVVATLPLEGDDPSTFLTYTIADRSLRLVLPRSWRIMVDRHDVTVLRWIDRGEMVAQCNISKLADAAPGKQLAMESFQNDIQRSLAKNFSQFVEAKEFKTANGLRGLRVVVAGVASELPIQWIYYHLTSDRGQQAAVVFTFDAKLAERFGAEDQTVVDACEFLAPPTEATKPAATARKPAAESRDDGAKR